jgi:hypothetical protein
MKCYVQFVQGAVRLVDRHVDDASVIETEIVESPTTPIEEQPHRR